MFRSLMEHSVIILSCLRNVKEPVTLAKIEQVTGVSVSTLEHTANKLVLSGLIVGKRGPNGGYLLTFEGKNVTLEKLAEALGYDCPYTEYFRKIKVETL